MCQACTKTSFQLSAATPSKLCIIKSIRDSSDEIQTHCIALRNRKTVPTKDQEILNKCDTSFDAWSLGVFCERQRSLLISVPTGRANTELSFSER